jgi:hypothetical protein
MQVYADFVIDHCSGVAVSILRGRKPVLLRERAII